MVTVMINFYLNQTSDFSEISLVYIVVPVISTVYYFATFEIEHVLLTWVRGFWDKGLYLVLVSLHPSVLGELSKQKNLKKMQF